MSLQNQPAPREHVTKARELCEGEKSAELVLACTQRETGLCLECGAVSESSVEPDARRYRCTECGAMAVYGAEEIILMGAPL